MLSEFESKVKGDVTYVSRDSSVWYWDRYTNELADCMTIVQYDTIGYSRVSVKTLVQTQMRERWVSTAHFRLRTGSTKFATVGKLPLSKQNATSVT